VSEDQPQAPRDIEDVLARPAGERLREYKYRFSQSAVFGLPVVGLHWFGEGLGGEDAARWSGLIQALLAGWVMYVGAAGALFEGAILWKRGRMTGQLVVSGVAVGVYFYSVLVWLMSLVRGGYWPTRPVFVVAVLLVMGWSGWGWWRMARQAETPE
jgi:cation transport ATPase